MWRTDAEAEAPILWPPHAKSWLIWKDPDAGKDWRQEEKGTTEDEMVGWHHLLDGHEFEQALGVGDGQGSLACCSPWGHKKSDMTEWLNWTDSGDLALRAPFWKLRRLWCYIYLGFYFNTWSVSNFGSIIFYDSLDRNDGALLVSLQSVQLW